MEITQGQIQAAARAVKSMLSDPDVKVPVPAASSGALYFAWLLVRMIETGKLVVVDPATHEAGLAAMVEVEKLKKEKTSGQ